MLDTNICIYIINEKPASVLKRFLQYTPQSFSISIVTYAELYYGVLKSLKTEHNLKQLHYFSEQLTVKDWGLSAAQIYGSIRKAQESRGTTIGPYDYMIAAHALSENLTLVTNNVKEFERIKDLQVENWV